MTPMLALVWVVFALLVATVALSATIVAIVASRPVATVPGSGSGSGPGPGPTPALAGGLGGAMNPRRIPGPLAEFPAKGLRGSALTRQLLRTAKPPATTRTERLPGAAGAATGAATPATGAIATATGPPTSYGGSSAPRALPQLSTAEAMEHVARAGTRRAVVFVVRPDCPACVKLKDALARVGAASPELVSHVALLDTTAWRPLAHVLPTETVPQAFLVGGNTATRALSGAPSDEHLAAFLRSSL
jgi:hypothetical protein